MNKTTTLNTRKKKQTHTHSTEIKCKWSKQSSRAMANAICVNWREYTKKHTHTAIKITITSALKRQQQQRLHFYIIKLKLCSRFFATKSHYKYLSFFFASLCVLYSVPMHTYHTNAYKFVVRPKPSNFDWSGCNKKKLK